MVLWAGGIVIEPAIRSITGKNRLEQPRTLKVIIALSRQAQCLLGSHENALY